MTPHTAEAETVLATLPGLLAHRPRTAHEPVSAPLIHAWCDAVGERNPRFTGTHPVAPRASMQMWTLPGLRPGRSPAAGPAEPGDLDEEVRARLSAAGYTSSLAVETDQQFLADLWPGDVVTDETRYVDVSWEKRTALGRGFFVRSATTYATLQGNTIGRLTLTVFHYAPEPRRETRARRPPGTAGARRAVPPPRLVRGAALMPVSVPVTTTLIVSGALATRDFYPVHHDRDFARAHGNPDILMNILTTNGLLARIVGEWTGGALLERLVTRLRAPVFPHSILSLTGQVDERSHSMATLRVRASAGGEVHADVTATVELGETAGE